MSSSDLFRAYNIDFVSRFSPGNFRPGVVLGPPASGKSFIISNYYSSNACESIIGFPNPEPVEACSEYGGVSEPARASGPMYRVVDFLRAVFPWVRALMETKPVSKVLDELGRRGFSDVEIEAVRSHFTGVDRVPKRLISHLINLRSEYGSVMLYGIPWDVDVRYGLSGEVSEAVAMIKRHFEKGIKWLGVKYIPPGLVAEVVEKIGEEGRDRAEEYVREQANAYYRVVKILVGEEDVEFKGLLAVGVMNLMNQFTTAGVRKLVSALTLIPGIGSITISVVALAAVLTLTYQLMRRNPEVSVVDELIGLRGYWLKLHESLRRLIASKVALQLGTTPKEAEEALNQLTGIEIEQLSLSELIALKVALQLGTTPGDTEEALNKLTGMEVDRLKQLINDVQSKLRELEEEVKRLKDDVRRLELKGIFEVYWVDDFMRGLVYPGVRVVNGGLMIHTLTEKYEDVYWNVVTSGAFEAATSELAKRLRGGGLTVVVGPRGIGKSTLTAKVLWDLLSSRKFNAVVRVRELDGEMRKMLLALLDMCRSERYGVVCGSPVILYDPSPPVIYKLPTEARKAVVGGIEETLKHLSTIAEQAPVIAVLPSDVVSALGDDARRVIEGKEYTPDMKDEEFLSDLITEYSGCSIDRDKLREIVKIILDFDEGYILIARLVGEELRRSNCSVEDLLDKARGNATAFMVNYVNRRLGVVTETGEWDPKRIEAFSRILPVRYWLSFFAVEPGMFIMPRRFLAMWFGCEDLTYSEELITWLAQKQQSLIEDALGLITVFASYLDRGEAEEYLRNELKNLEQALTPWVENGEKLPKDMVGKLLNPLEYSYEDIANYFNNYFLNRECKDNERSERYVDELIQEFKPECWRRLALMAGTAVSRHPFNWLVNMVGDFLKESGDVFPGLAEAIKPCGIDGILLEGGELTPFSRALLRFGYDVYKAYTNVWGEVAGELRRLRDTWLRRYLPVEAVYALGLSILTARARHAEQDIDVETAKTALWLTNFGVQIVFDPLVVDFAIGLLHPLRDQYLDGWASLLDSAANVEVTPSVRDELKEIYGHVSNLEDWAKAKLALAYARAAAAAKTRGKAYKAYLNMACSLLNKMRDDMLRTIAEAHVYHVLASTGLSCRNADPCRELEVVNQRLEKLGEEASNPVEFLRNHPGLEEYLRWRSATRPEEAFDAVIKDAHDLALSGLGHCASRRIRKVAKILRELGDYLWVALVNYLIDRRSPIGIMAFKDLGEVVNEFKDLWGKALQEVGLKLNTLDLIATAYVLGGYLVTLALVGRRGDVEKLLKEYGWLLNMYMSEQLNVATRLVLKYLDVDVKAPSNEEVLETVEEDLRPELRLAMKEVLGGHVPIINALSTCEGFDERISCIIAYLAMQGNKEAEERIKQSIIDDLRRANVPTELLELLSKADIRQLIEVYAPTTPMSRLILLLRALVSGNRGLAILHAEVGRVKSSEFVVWKLFGDLADALKRSNEDEVRLAIAKLYFF